MSYYLDGASGAFYQSILQEARSDSAVMPLLMRQYLLGDIFKHVMVSLPLSMRGMGLANYLSVAGVLLFWPVARAMRATGKLLPFLAIVLPPMLMVGLHGFVSGSIPRYNLPLLAVYSFIIAFALNAVVLRLSGVARGYCQVEGKADGVDR